MFVFEHMRKRFSTRNGPATGLGAVITDWRDATALDDDICLIKMYTLSHNNLKFTFHSCNDRPGPLLVNAVRCSCESDPVVRSCPLNTLSPAKNHSSQPGHDKHYF